MRSGTKATWKDKEITIIGIEHKSSFGDFVKIKCDNEVKIVNSCYIKIIK